MSAGAPFRATLEPELQAALPSYTGKWTPVGKWGPKIHGLHTP